MTDLNLKYNTLKNILEECGSVTVAFSSGVDSTFLLKCARETLGKERVLAVTVSSVFIPSFELNEAEEFCKNNDINHVIINVDILANEEVAANPKNRCYICKKTIFNQIKELINGNYRGENLSVSGDIHIIESGFNSAICEGSNIDDTGDYRPGMQAIKELGIKSPLMEAELTKADIRKLSRELSLDTWDKPSAACLASRCAYGEVITEKKLVMTEKAESYLRDKGFSQLRVRIHGNENFIARIELMPDELKRLIGDESNSGSKAVNKDELYNYFKEIGFSYVTLDLKGYRVGSMNEVL